MESTDRLGIGSRRVRVPTMACRPRVSTRIDRPQHPRDTDVSRFEAVDLNRVVISSAGNAESYRAVHEPGGHESEWQVPRVSCSIRARAPAVKLKASGFALSDDDGARP